MPWVSAIGNTLGEDWRQAPATPARQKLHARALVNVVASRTINFMTTTQKTGYWYINDIQS